MRRREFVALLGCSLASNEIFRASAVRAEDNRVRRIGVLSEFSAAQMQPLVSAFSKRLHDLGWPDEKIQIDVRSAITQDAQFLEGAAALVETKPDLIVALGSRALRALKQSTQTISVVFTLVADPVAQGLVASLSRPGGNLTGLTNFEYSFAAKWIEALKEIEPRINRTMLMVNPQNSGTLALARSAEKLGPAYGVTMQLASVTTPAEIEEALTAFGEGSDRAVIVLPDGLVVDNRNLIIERVNRARIPAIFPFRVFAVNGGLLSWGLDFVDVYRQAAIYADRILRGANPAQLPIQAPNKFNLVVNLKTARAIGVRVPPTLLALADEVIE